MKGHNTFTGLIGAFTTNEPQFKLGLPGAAEENPPSGAEPRTSAKTTIYIKYKHDTLVERLIDVFHCRLQSEVDNLRCI